MTKGILGRKIGMTQLFLDNGELIPVNQTSYCKKRH